jgi:hypothetical protein
LFFLEKPVFFYFKGIELSHESLKEELFCHFPYVIFSACLSLILLNLLSVGNGMSSHGLSDLFHSFHFLHLIFAGTGFVLSFRKYSKQTFLCLLLAFVIPTFFCALSDIFLPTIGGKIVGVDMHVHWCLFQHFWSVFPFLAVGIINGFVIEQHYNSIKIFFSQMSHFMHIFVSSMASLLYLASFGFDCSANNLSLLFFILFFSVIIPCILSDVVVPVLFAELTNGKVKDLKFCNLHGKSDEINQA